MDCKQKSSTVSKKHSNCKSKTASPKRTTSDGECWTKTDSISAFPMWSLFVKRGRCFESVLVRFCFFLLVWQEWRNTRQMKRYSENSTIHTNWGSQQETPNQMETIGRIADLCPLLQSHAPWSPRILSLSLSSEQILSLVAKRKGNNQENKEYPSTQTPPNSCERMEARNIFHSVDC